jgi:hypothetical protein
MTKEGILTDNKRHSKAFHYLTIVHIVGKPFGTLTFGRICKWFLVRCLHPTN